MKSMLDEKIFKKTADDIQDKKAANLKVGDIVRVNTPHNHRIDKFSGAITKTRVDESGNSVVEFEGKRTRPRATKEIVILASSVVKVKDAELTDDYMGEFADRIQGRPPKKQPISRRSRWDRRFDSYYDRTPETDTNKDIFGEDQTSSPIRDKFIEALEKREKSGRGEGDIEKNVLPRTGLANRR